MELSADEFPLLDNVLLEAIDSSPEPVEGVEQAHNNAVSRERISRIAIVLLTFKAQPSFVL